MATSRGRGRYEGMRPRPVLLAAAAAAALLAPATAGATATGIGRATFELGGTEPRPSIDPLGFSAGVTLPDGGTVTAAAQGRGRVRLLALRRDGTPDPAFGVGGARDVTIPVDTGRLESVYQLLRRPDGRLLLVTSGLPVGAPNTLPQVAITGLTASGAPDPGFAGGRTLETGTLVAAEQPVALAPDGGIILTGSADETQAAPPVGLRTDWVVRRLDASGVPDDAFGVVTLPGGGAAGGQSVGVAPDGAIWVLGHAGDAYVLRRLLPSGRLDPAFAGGGAVPVTGSFGAGLVVRADGSADVIAATSNEADGGVLTRIRPDGTPDPAFHGGKPLRVAAGTLLPGPAGEDVVVDAPFGLSLDGPTSIRTQRVAAGGTVALDRTTPTGLAGGAASSATSVRPPLVTGTDQSDVSLVPVGVRPDGSIVVAGAVATIIGTGEGAGYEHDRGAVVSLAADGTPDPRFGGPESRATLRLAVPSQHTTIATTKGVYAIKLTATTSDIGLVDLRVTANGRAVAVSTAPAFAMGRQTLRALLTKTARTSLRHHHDVRVTVRGTFVDILGHRATATAHGVLK